MRIAWTTDDLVEYAATFSNFLSNRDPCQTYDEIQITLADPCALRARPDMRLDSVKADFPEKLLAESSDDVFRCPVLSRLSQREHIFRNRPPAAVYAVVGVTPVRGAAAFVDGVAHCAVMAFPPLTELF